MIKITEAVSDIVVVRSVDVQLVNLVVDILTNLDILGGGSTSFVLVSRNIDPERLQCGQTISGHQSLCSFPLNQLDTLVIVTGTQFTPVPPRIEKQLAKVSYFIIYASI